MRVLKFRSFSSKDRQGFIFFFEGEIEDIIFEDILFQLFLPLFPDILCPEIYYFSSTDQSLSFKEMLNETDYIYIHFVERVELYNKKGYINDQFILCPLE